MTTFTDRATQLLETLKDCARDMESDLGKASRVTEFNPTLGSVARLTEQRFQPAGLAQIRDTITRAYLESHRMNAIAADELIRSIVATHAETLTGPEQSVVESIRALAAQMKAVGTTAQAKALVASL